MSNVDIPYLNFGLGFLLILIPIYFLKRYRTGLVKSTLMATLRMTVQLLLIGFYLEYLFTINNPWINCLWVIIMLVIAAYTTISRVKLPIRHMLLPMSIAFFIAIAIIDIYFMGVVLSLSNLFDARYFIPISGMILGNMLTANVIALNAFISGITRERALYMFLLANGATKQEALAHFIKEALVKSFNPTIASMAVMGLIALPGTMTGQILGGSSPTVAIRYQVMLMITIFASSLVSVLITLWCVERSLFAPNGMLKEFDKK
ncbi:MAG: ABC transporter permease [Marinifilaceae bacterium]